MVLAEEIVQLVQRTPGLTDEDLARKLQHACHPSQIRSICRRLISEGLIKRAHPR